MKSGSAGADFELAAAAPGTLALSGVLNFATAAQALQAMREALAAGTVSTLDLSGVAHGDSAGLACLLAVTAEASGRGPALCLMHLPEGMQALAGVCGVEHLLG